MHRVHPFRAKQIDVVCFSVSVSLRVSWSVCFVWRSAKCDTLCMMHWVGFIHRDRVFCVFGDGV